MKVVALGVWKTGNISETVEDRSKVTNGLYKVARDVSIMSSK